MKFLNGEKTAVTVLNQNNIGISVAPGATWYSQVDYKAEVADASSEYYGLKLTLVAETTGWSPVTMTDITGDETATEEYALEHDTEQIVIVNEGGYYIELGFFDGDTNVITIPDNYRLTLNIGDWPKSLTHLYVDFEDAVATGITMYQMRKSNILFEQIV